MDASPGTAGLYFIHPDHLGRPQNITSTSGALAWDGQFRPFGEVHALSATIVARLMFPGQLYDPETQLHQNWHRDYDPSTGRYIQSDPIGLDGGINTYAYVAGNPLTRVDPLGLAALGESIGQAIGQAVGGWIGWGVGGATGGAAGGTVCSPGGPVAAAGCAGSGARIGSTAGAAGGRWAGGELGGLIGSGIEDAWNWCFSEEASEADCDQEWEDAREYCRRLLNSPNAPRRLTGGYTTIEKCVKGFVTEECGGNPLDWGRAWRQ